MKKNFLIIFFLSLHIFWANAQDKNLYDLKKYNDTKQMVLFFQYIEHFEWHEYYDQNIGYVYDTSGLTRFNSSDTNDIWQICSPDKGTWTVAYHQPSADTFPSKVLITDSINPYPTNNTSVIEFQIIKPQWAMAYNLCWSNFNFEFRYKCETDTLKDGFFVDVSFDGGNTFANTMDTTQVMQMPNAPQSFDYTLPYVVRSPLNGSYGITGSNLDVYSGWAPYNLYYSWDNSHAHDVDSAIVRIIFTSDSVQMNKRGVMIDYVLISAEDQCYVSTENSSLKYTVQLYPNPISETSILEFSNPNCETHKLEIVDVNGKIVFEDETNDQQFNIGSIVQNKGNYYYRLSNNNGVVKIDNFVKNN